MREKENNSGKNSFKLFSGWFVFFTLLIGILYFVAARTTPSIDSNTVMYFKMNNQSSYGENDTHIYDFSLNGNNGTIFGYIPFNSTGGFLGDGDFYFNGSSNNYINGTNSTSVDFNISSNFTISAWAKPYHSSSQTTTVIITKTPGAGAYPFIMRYTNATGIFSCAAYNGTTTGGYVASSTDSTGAGHLVTCTFNSSYVSLYVDKYEALFISPA